MFIVHQFHPLWVSSVRITPKKEKKVRKGKVSKRLYGWCRHQNYLSVSWLWNYRFSMDQAQVMIQSVRWRIIMCVRVAHVVWPF